MLTTSDENNDKFNPVFPVNSIDEKLIVDPEGLIQLALSKYRKADNCSDIELSEYICELLGFVMNSNKVIINQIKPKESRFHVLTFEKAK
jgi:hypothetical protein